MSKLTSEALEVFWANGDEAIIIQNGSYYLRGGNDVAFYGKNTKMLKDLLEQAGRTDIIDSLISQGKL